MDGVPRRVSTARSEQVHAGTHHLIDRCGRLIDEVRSRSGARGDSPRVADGADAFAESRIHGRHDVSIGNRDPAPSSSLDAEWTDCLATRRSLSDSPSRVCGTRSPTSFVGRTPMQPCRVRSPVRRRSRRAAILECGDEKRAGRDVIRLGSGSLGTRRDSPDVIGPLRGG